MRQSGSVKQFNYSRIKVYVNSKRIKLSVNIKNMKEAGGEQSRSEQSTAEELTEMIGKISIPEDWKKPEPRTASSKEKLPITSEYLQNIGKQIVDGEPMKQSDWENVLETLYNRVNYSEQPEAKRLWELFLEKGISSAAQLVGDSNVEEITNVYGRGSEINRWRNLLGRMMSVHAGTPFEMQLKLSEETLEQCAVPLAKRAHEIDPDGKYPGEPWIKDCVRNIINSRIVLKIIPYPGRNQINADIDKRTDEIIAEIVGA